LYQKPTKVTGLHNVTNEKCGLLLRPAS